MRPSRTRYSFPAIRPDLVAALQAVAADQQTILAAQAGIAVSAARGDAPSKPGPLPTGGCIDRLKLRDCLERIERNFPVDLAELIVIGMVAKRSRRRIAPIDAVVIDVLSRRAMELLLEYPQAFSPELKVPLLQGQSMKEVGRRKLAMALMQDGLRLDGRTLRPVLERSGAEHLAALFHEEGLGLDRGDPDGLHALFEDAVCYKSLAALYELGLPVGTLRIASVAREAGAAAARRSVDFADCLHLLEVVAARMGDGPLHRIALPLPIRELLAQVDTSWASARTAHPLYAAFCAMTSASAADINAKDVDGVEGFPEKPLRLLDERLNALMSKDSQLPLSDVLPLDLLKLAVLCQKALENAAVGNFFNVEPPFSGRSQRSPDDILRWLATEHVGRGQRLLPEDLHGNRRDRGAMAGVLTLDRLEMLDAMASENAMRARIDEVRACGHQSEDASRPARRRPAL